LFKFKNKYIKGLAIIAILFTVFNVTIPIVHFLGVISTGLSLLLICGIGTITLLSGSYCVYKYDKLTKKA
jgi:hypothetical protein